jgi:formamidopyrimidine-DNA glycosylase
VPELPDITAYLTALEPRVVGQPLEHLRIASPLLLRTAVPRIETIEGRTVRSLRRIGKRIVFCFDDDLFLVLHLMIAGRLHWRDLKPNAERPKLGGRNNLAAFDFPHGSLTLTEAGTKRRASLHLVRGEQALADLDPGGIDVLSASPEQFQQALTTENRTLKRALTDPRILSGIGNAYSDEILHAAQLSPLTLTRKLTPEEFARLYTATLNTLQTGSPASTRKPKGLSPKKSLPSARRWPPTAATCSRARAAGHLSSASVTPTTRPTTAPSARPAAKSSPTARSPACSAPTGHARSTSSKLCAISKRDLASHRPKIVRPSRKDYHGEARPPSEQDVSG